MDRTGQLMADRCRIKFGRIDEEIAAGVRGDRGHQPHVALHTDQVGVHRDMRVVQLRGQIGNLVRGKKVSTAQAVAEIDQGACVRRGLA